MSTDDPQWASGKRKVIEQRISEANGRLVRLAAERHAADLSLITGACSSRPLKSIEKEIGKERKRKDKLEREREACLQEEKRGQEQAQPVRNPAENLSPTPGNVLAGKKPENVREEQPERAYQSSTTSESASPSSAPSGPATILKKISREDSRMVDRVIEEMGRRMERRHSSAPDEEPKKKPGKGRPPDRVVEWRREIIRKVSATGVTGAAYCMALGQVIRMIDKTGLDTPVPWQKEKPPCPKSYIDAWRHPDPKQRKKWRQRIADEKSKATSQNSH